MQKFHVVDEEMTDEQNGIEEVEETSSLSEKIEDLEDEVNETNKKYSANSSDFGKIYETKKEKRRRNFS